MSDAGRHKRRIVTGVDTSGPVPVEYRFSHARNGNRHLVVVFANPGAPDDYGMSGGVLDKVRANVLWIRDQFDGANAYYLCKGMDFGVEQSVAGLIARVAGALSLTPDQCTLIGSSKGGSAALYFGLKYGYRNIVASVPQFLIGTYARESLPEAARLMTGEPTEDKVRFLDAVLPDLLRGRPNPGAHIYLLCSAQDEQYPRQVEPFLGLFRGYERFNLVFNDSVLVTDSSKVVAHNVPVIMGLLNLLVDGVSPVIGGVRYGYEEPQRDTSGIEAYLSATSQKRGDDFPAPVVLMPAAEQRLPAHAVRFVGSAPRAVRVSIWENGTFQGSPSVAPDGSWSWLRDKPWGKGRHVVRLFGVDANNFHSQRSEVVFTVVDVVEAPDPVSVPAQPLALTVASPGAQQQVPGPVPRFAGFAPGAVRVEFQEAGMSLGACPVAADGNWTWESDWAWNEGPHFVEAVAVGAGGNASAWISVPFTVGGSYPVPGPGGYSGVRH